MACTAAFAESTAAQRVLETPELLEMIISSLPPIEVLLLQRVSQIWNDLIASSPLIQRMLFLRPDWNLEAKSFDAGRPINRPGDRPKNNRLLRPMLDDTYPVITFKINDDGDEDKTSADITGHNSNTQIVRKNKPTSGHWSWDVNIIYPAAPSTRPAVLYEKASWRKMYISQPPCTSLHIVRNWQTSSLPAMECESGITMEFFMEKAAKAREVGSGVFVSSDGGVHFEGSIKCSSIKESETQFGTKEVVYDQYVLERLMGIGYLANMH